MIGVNMVAANVYEVVVEGDTETRHRVHMSQEYYHSLCGASVTHEYVLVQAFRFLLEHEPNTAILAEFELSDIARYFPEFEAALKERLDRCARESQYRFVQGWTISACGAAMSVLGIVIGSHFL